MTTRKVSRQNELEFSHALYGSKFQDSTLKMSSLRQIKGPLDALASQLSFKKINFKKQADDLH